MKTHKKALSIGLIIALAGFPQISETIYSPALPNVASGLNASAYSVEATLAIYFVGFALGVLLWGAFSDNYGRRKIMLLGLAIYGLGTLGCANAGNVEALLACRFIQAFGASVGSVITQTILRDLYEGSERTKLFFIVSGALSFSPAIGPVLGGVISEYLGWRANFWVLAVLGIVMFIWSFLTLPETRPKILNRLSRSQTSQLLRDMLNCRALRGHVVLIGATNGILFGFYQEAPFVFIEQLGVKPSYYGLIGVVIALSTLLAAKVSYRQSGEGSFRNIIQRGTACIFTGSIVFSLTALLGIFEMRVAGISIAISMLFLIFFGIGLIVPNSLSQALKPFQGSVGTAGSIFGGGYYCLIALFTWIMSLLHNGSILPLPLYMTAISLLLAWACRMIRPSHEEVKILA